MKPPDPPPRYDETYFEGLAALDVDDSTPPNLPTDASMPGGWCNTYVTTPLPLGALLLDPAHNVSRNGAIDSLAHPEVRQIVTTLRADDTLCHCVGVRPLAQPLKRPCNPAFPCCTPERMGIDGALVTHHTHEIWWGFRRMIALQAVGRTHLYPAKNEIKWLVEHDGALWSDEKCGMTNIVENTARGNPNDFDLALALHGLHKKQSLAELARKTGLIESDVTNRVRMIERLPVALKAAWHRRPTPSVIRSLVKISRFDPQDALPLEERHAQMVEHWERAEAYEAGRKVAREAKAAVPPAAVVPAPPWLGRKKNRANRAGTVPVPTLATQTRRLREAVDRAREICEPDGTWRPLDERERTFAQALLGVLARGDSATLLR